MDLTFEEHSIMSEKSSEESSDDDGCYLCQPHLYNPDDEAG